MRSHCVIGDSRTRIHQLIVALPDGGARDRAYSNSYEMSKSDFRRPFVSFAEIGRRLPIPDARAFAVRLNANANESQTVQMVHAGVPRWKDVKIPFGCLVHDVPFVAHRARRRGKK